MTLDKWMRNEQMTNDDFAKIIGVDSSYVLRMRKSERRPSPEIAAKIEKATDEKVKRMDLLYPN